MCKVRTGADLRNKQDVKSLITSLILSQQEKYNEASLVSSVKWYMSDAPFHLSDKEIIAMIDRGLDVFIRCGEITCVNGWYYPRGIFDLPVQSALMI